MRRFGPPFTCRADQMQAVPVSTKNIASSCRRSGRRSALPKETLDGQKVDVVGIKLADKEFAAAKQYEKLFGPDWNKLRLAVHGKQVVAAGFGSGVIESRVEEPQGR